MMRNLWSPDDVASYFGVPVQTVYQWRHKNYGPPCRKVGRHLRYKPEEVENWFNSLEV